MASDHRSLFPKLGESNYSSWVGNMRVHLMTKEVWSLVKGEETQPSPSEPKELKIWRLNRDIAAGEIYLSLEPSQLVHIKNLEEDPVQMWKKLESVHLQKRPVTRFNAYDALFSIRKEDNESLSSLMSRVDEAMQHVQDLRPSKFTIDDLDGELASMSLIRSLSDDYRSFISSLMLLPQFDYATVKEAFILEEQNRRPRASSSSSALSSMATPAARGIKANNKVCDFCKLKGHLVEACFRYRAAQQQAEQSAKEKKKQGKPSYTARQAEVEEPKENLDVAHIAGNASTLLDLSNPASALIVDASSDWTADTGASSHMTPHQHWFTSYTPLRISIHLADGQPIYSVGTGSVRFKPSGKRLPHSLLEFKNVLHVPDLKINLFSVLHATVHKGFNVSIVGPRMFFCHQVSLLFTATASGRNTTALLDGVTEPMTEFAGLISTCPLDLTLWHRRFAHLNFSDVKQLVLRELVTGIDIKSSTPPDPICEPCISGKQHRVVNKTASRATELLFLIHSDLHGPLPVRTPEGYRYWVTFIDDATRLWALYLLREKSDTFHAFKSFKAYVENLTDKRIKTLRDDKGGEYMSNEFGKFLEEAGIARQHTVHNEPHQNGVAERANRTFAEGATSLLAESHLPASFWGYAVTTLVYVRNRSSTSALNGNVPYSCFFGKKPDVSHLRVFGC